jgi:hypothetical protein
MKFYNPVFVRHYQIIWFPTENNLALIDTHRWGNVGRFDSPPQDSLPVYFLEESVLFNVKYATRAQATCGFLPQQLE